MLRSDKMESETSQERKHINPQLISTPSTGQMGTVSIEVVRWISIKNFNTQCYRCLCWGDLIAFPARAADESPFEPFTEHSLPCGTAGSSRGSTSANIGS